VAAAAGRWLLLLAVATDARGQGAGSALLAAVEQRTTPGRLRTMDQPGNYLAPGIDERNEDTIAWCERRGFVRSKRYENIKVPLVGNALIDRNPTIDGFVVKRAEPSDRDALLACARSFAASWEFEIARAYEVNSVHIATLPDGQVVAFAAHDGNNRGLGWFGPAGTLEAYRGKGLGEALLLPCLRDVRDAGHEWGVIAWIGPRAFYAKAAGAVDDRAFVVLEKTW
jgi:GNAT superfamily N-acetyltransferase